MYFISLFFFFFCFCYVACLPGLNNVRIPTCVPVARMSTGPWEGAGDNLKYALLMGAAFVGSLAYVSESVVERFRDVLTTNVRNLFGKFFLMLQI